MPEKRWDPRQTQSARAGPPPRQEGQEPLRAEAEAGAARHSARASRSSTAGTRSRPRSPTRAATCARSSRPRTPCAGSPKKGSPCRSRPRSCGPDAIAARLSPDAVHQGLLVEADPLPALDLEDLSDDGTVLVLDQITDPHNVGAILRTAAAFAVEARSSPRRGIRPRRPACWRSPRPARSISCRS